MQALPTLYNGITYRSRTEARWAVVFDKLGWQYFYEMEGFELPSGRYLPDFYLAQFRTFFEVKGHEPTSFERQKADELALHTRCDVILSKGPPNPNRNEWDEDLLSYVYEEVEDEPIVFEYSGGFVSRRRDSHAACSLHLGNLGRLGAKRNIGWRDAFRVAANSRFGIHP